MTPQMDNTKVNLGGRMARQIHCLTALLQYMRNELSHVVRP